MFDVREVQFTEKPLLKPVFFGSAIVIISFVTISLLLPSQASEAFQHALQFVSKDFGWLYLLGVSMFVALSLILLISPIGAVRLGPEGSAPEFSYTSWIAMLFSAGMGIGLLYFGVAEPLSHYLHPPSARITPQSLEAVKEAMQITFFHWGISAWAVYAVVGLGLAYFAYRHNLPLTVRSALYPLIGDRIYGWPGHLVDIFAVLGTLFGVATSLGLGVMQVNAGLTHLFGIPNNVTMQVIFIAIITGMATISVVSGLDAGIKRLSELNLGAAVILLLATLILGPTLFLLQAFVQNIGMYISNFVEMAFNMYVYEGVMESEATQKWLQGWTLFYWGWWISWSPFVGMFIARISKGRTIREFLIGVLFVPMLFTFLWMTVFGGSAIFLAFHGKAFNLTEPINSSTALFEMFNVLPFGTILSFLSVLLVITFFVTSSDSGSLVVDTITSGGRDDAPVWQRIFWAVFEGLIAATLLIAGGKTALNALQAASITAALPFIIVLFLFCLGLAKAFKDELYRTRSFTAQANVAYATNLPWKKRLKYIVTWPRSAEVYKYLEETVKPAMEAVKGEILTHTDGMALDVSVEVTMHPWEDDENNKLRGLELILNHGEETSFLYSARLVRYTIPTFAYMERNKKDDTAMTERKFYYRLEPYTLEGSQGYDIYGLEKEQVIQDILQLYENHLLYLQMVRE